MAQNQTLPLGSGLGAIRAPSLQGDANEAAFRRDASSGGLLGQLFNMYPTQQEAIDARKTAQSRISDILGGLMGGGASSSEPMFMPDESSGMNIDGSEPTQTPFYIGEFGKDLGGQILKDLRGLYSGPNIRTGTDLRSELTSGDIFDVTGGGGLSSTRMPLTGERDQPGQETFGGTIPRATEDIIDFDVPPADFDGEMGEDLSPASEQGDEIEISPNTSAIADDLDADLNIEDAVNQSKKGGKLTPQEEAFAAGMKQYKEALGEDITGIGSIDDYKKEFAEATGIDVSGKVDNSQALMAFGLALMQNKAGKGFNVGKLLSAVGEAGEKAMPAMAEARQEARAGQLAAGKYALQERKGAITQALENRKLIASRIAELSDKAYDRETQMQVERLKAAAKIEDRKLQELAANQRESLKLERQSQELGSLSKINLGDEGVTEKYEVQVQQIGKTGSFKMLDPKGEMNRVTDRIKAADSQIATVNKMFDIAEAGGISGAEGFYNYLASKVKGLGVDLPYSDASKIEDYNAAMSKLLTQARRLLTGGEAGNAISDRDVRIMEEGMGLVRNDAGEILFTSADQAKSYVQNLQELFNRKKAELVTVKDRLYKFGLQNGEYIDYVEPQTNKKITENEDFSDDFSGYEPSVVNGRIRYTIKKTKS